MEAIGRLPAFGFGDGLGANQTTGGKPNCRSCNSMGCRGMEKRSSPLSGAMIARAFSVMRTILLKFRFSSSRHQVLDTPVFGSGSFPALTLPLSSPFQAPGQD